ncbi:protein gamma response 1 [Oryza brachyantha]|nr:protein gamma response 1 [Oryza brachyantha]XP_040381359.1 protein gamma response 1 [Oryza brachyantha]
MDGSVLGVSGANCGGDVAADEFKYFSGVSTIFVANIQEVKDRVSQIELIFCSQLFPHVQSMSKLLEAQLANAAEAAKDEWREREAGLVRRLEELSSGKRHAEEKALQLGCSLEEMKGSLADAVARHEVEKKQLLGRLEDELGKKDEVVRRLEREIAEKAADVSRERDAHQRLLEQVALKDKELLLEQNKRAEVIEDYTKLKTLYKELKSKYTFLTRKIDQNESSKSAFNNLAEQKSSSKSPPSKRKLKDLVDTKKDNVQVVSKTKDEKNGLASCAKAGGIQHDSSLIRSPFSNSRLCLPSRPTNTPPKNAISNSKTEATSSFARPSLHWRETRACKEPGVVDPHDDFLDTPLEAVKNMIRNPTTREEAQALAACPPQDMDFNNSDDETQDVNIATQGLKNMPVPKQQSTISIHPSSKGFKYTEPVRKKADRENLKGVECKQCKKFYDAVLPDGRANGDGANSTSMRCEHHDGVSRHRYRYAPPLTPEGFWNIGFESEM